MLIFKSSVILVTAINPIASADLMPWVRVKRERSDLFANVSRSKLKSSLMFSTIGMSTKNRTSSKSSVTNMKNQSFFGSNWIIIHRITCSFSHNIHNRHFIFMLKHVKNDQRTRFQWPFRVQMAWYIFHNNSDIRTNFCFIFFAFIFVTVLRNNWFYAK